MRKYAIVTNDHLLGHWFTGDTYSHQGEIYAVFASYPERDKAKTWQTRNGANKAAEKLRYLANTWGGELSVVELINQ